MFQISELEDQKRDCQKSMEQVKKLERKRDEVKTQLRTIKKTRDELEQGLETKYSDSTEKLQDMLSTFEADHQVQNNFATELDTTQQCRSLGLLFSVFWLSMHYIQHLYCSRVDHGLVVKVIIASLIVNNY